MEDGREYIVIEQVNEKGEVEERLINIEEAAELINEISGYLVATTADLNDAEAEVEFWKSVYGGEFSGNN
jgi:hypothetical protein